MSDTGTNRIARVSMAVLVAMSLFTAFGGVVTAEEQSEDPDDNVVFGIVECADVSVNDDGTVVVQFGNTIITVDVTEGDVDGVVGACVPN